MKDAYGKEITTRLQWSFSLAIGGPLAGKWIGSDRPNVDTQPTREVKTGTVKVKVRAIGEGESATKAADVAVYVPYRMTGELAALRAEWPALFAKACDALKVELPAAEIVVRK